MSLVNGLLRAQLRRSAYWKPKAKSLMRLLDAVDARRRRSVLDLRSRLSALRSGSAAGARARKPPPSARLPQSSRPVAILGYDAGTPDLVKAALASGYRPIALHAPEGGPSGGRLDISEQELRAFAAGSGTEIESPGTVVNAVGSNEFSDLVRESKIPVLLGTISGADRTTVANALLDARQRFNPQGRILHPAMLIDSHRSSARRFAVIAFPGSGNMIVQNVCRRLLPPPRQPIWSRDPLSATLTGYALSYWLALHGQLASAFDGEGRWQDVAGPTHMHYGSIYVALRDHKTEAFIGGLPQRAFTWANPWHTGHEPLTAQAYSFFSERNFEIVQILRHPLDVIVSNAGKMTVASGERVPQLLLQDDAWMDGMLKAVEAYWAGIAEHLDASGVSFVRYEALMSDPVRTIQQLAEVLGATCSANKARSIWSALGNRPLASVGHMWAPGAGKWRKYIPRRLVERIRASRLREYAEAAGYRFDVEDFEGTRSEVPVNACDPMYLAWEDGRWEIIIGKSPTFEHPKVYRVRDKDTGLLMICAREYGYVMDNLRTSPALRALLAAAGTGAWSEPPLLSDVPALRGGRQRSIRPTATQRMEAF